jgi:DNA polymerase III delta prime subunit
VGKKLAALAFAGELGARVTVVQRLEDKHMISIKQVRDVIEALAWTSSDPRAVIFDDAHRMSEEAMNAILKTLEEPPEKTFLILVTHLPDLLLETIRSRCQTIHFAPMSDDALADYARTTLHLGDEEARVVALLSEGSIGAATAMVEEIGEIRSAARDLQTRVLSGELNSLIEALGKIKDTDTARRAAKRDLRLLVHVLRETLRARSGSTPCLATAEFISKHSKIDEDGLIERMETLLDHERMIDLYANVGLAVEDALLRL